MFRFEDGAYWNFGKFEPKSLTDGDVIRDGLENFMYDRTGGRHAFEARQPGHFGSALKLLNTKPGQRTSIIDKWHQDGGQLDQHLYVIVWANVAPTELTPAVYRPNGFKDPFGTPIVSEPGDVIAFDNNAFFHRTPKMFKTVAKMRWFARSFYRSPLKEPPPQPLVVTDTFQRNFGDWYNNQDIINKLREVLEA